MLERFHEVRVRLGLPNQYLVAIGRFSGQLHRADLGLTIDHFGVVDLVPIRGHERVGVAILADFGPRGVRHRPENLE